MMARNGSTWIRAARMGGGRSVANTLVLMRAILNMACNYSQLMGDRRNGAQFRHLSVL